MLRPRGHTDGARLRVEEGIRSRRAFTVAVVGEAQSAALEAAKQYAAGTQRGNLLPPDLNFRQAKRRFYYLCSRAGLTERNGVFLRRLRGRMSAGSST